MNARISSLALIVALAGCADRTADFDDPAPTRVACVVITGWGYWDNGDKHVIINEETGSSGTACLCLTDEEVLSGARNEELNDLAFAECTRLVDLFSGGFDWDDCEENYLAGAWTSGLSFAEGDDHAWMNSGGLDCNDGADESLGCSTDSEPGPASVVLSALLALALLRQRRG
ncbi:hypothetical protein ENSA5_37170 [Enhygromyxa salina]|uniref:Uncharacterized protein n=1 Tax=Enhygromyxa salina TaxID=215803 RepID=A0A2S9XSL4_9BACT|nr:MYXO-CTERM sorting domain-containing protein [Enhygromyxa salina]PRP95848.1 hypothetical protein ENSA5_37170 [Enhygromyxa salina]